MKIIYPLTIIYDRYSGVYSGGKYTAWNKHPIYVPEEIAYDDVSCAVFWDDYNKDLVGLGNTPDEAIKNLKIKLNRI